MRKSAVDAEQLLRVSARLGDAAIDPALWPQLMAQISAAARAKGAIFLQTDARIPDVPRTESVEESTRRYFTKGWHARDARRLILPFLHGESVVIDQDIFTQDEINCSNFYQDLLASGGLKWFAGIACWSGAALWALAIQRAASEGPFDQQDKRALAVLSRRLTEMATLSKVIGRAVLSGMTNVLHLVRQPALALDRLGFVIGMNPAAEQIFDDQFRGKDRRLFVRDQGARAAFTAFIDRLRITPDTAVLPAAPMSPERAAEELGIARETARNQLKAVFSKTDTHRQAELVALLSLL